MNLLQDDWAEELKADPNAIILDVRTEEEYNEAHIPNSILLDYYRGQDFIDELNELDRDKSYYVYCRTGNRSGQTCAIMNQLGFENAYNLVGGIEQWEGEIES